MKKRNRNPQRKRQIDIKEMERKSLQSMTYAAAHDLGKGGLGSHVISGVMHVVMSSYKSSNVHHELFFLL